MKTKHLLLYIWSKMLSSSLDSLINLSQMTSPHKLIPSDCITLYIHSRNRQRIITYSVTVVLRQHKPKFINELRRHLSQVGFEPMISGITMDKVYTIQYTQMDNVAGVLLVRLKQYGRLGPIVSLFQWLQYEWTRKFPDYKIIYPSISL